MAATRAEIIEGSGKQLDASSVGIALSGEDFNLIGDVYDGLHERYLILNKIYWSDSNCVPLESKGLITAILSGTVITEDSDFGLSDQEIQKITLMQDRAELTLMNIVNDVPTGESVKTDYF